MNGIDNIGGWLRYRCRMCGEEFQGLHVPDIGKAISAVLFDHPNPWPLSGFLPRITESHHHKNKSRGVAELIGGVPDSE